MGQPGLHVAGALLAVGILLAACQNGDTVSPVAIPATRPITSTAELPPHQQIEPREIGQDGLYTHRWSGMTLPTVVGPFQRRKVVTFDEAALDVSGEYLSESASGFVHANVYIYPIDSGATASPRLRILPPQGGK